MADMRYAGIARLEVPDKKNANLLFHLRRERNKAIRGNRMVNEWATGYVNIQYRILLKRCYYSPELYAMAFKATCLTANWRFERLGYALKCREIYEARNSGREKPELATRSGATTNRALSFSALVFHFRSYI